ncbi:unnamed protein product [Rhizophagus irregularis]|uniref:F-box domain-containing protein n=1 Tax=Rhizophagus irregularis TaxID=588596 RepID=A0A2N1NMZ0_9GLOM|nr:hypothetical protein RhiirC2_846181 [Rhizophagus irregularis]CAB4400764.1 unnamed protein product [Rhizophagus irregularis]CAB5380090.1 unnamed protein product [Rhizophagus irregularis]
MAFQLPIDCLIKILVCLEDDKVTLYSCLLVNRLWCRISVEILWRYILNPGKNIPYKQFKTLINLLPKESKDLIRNWRISIPNSTSKSPLFNYASFLKVLSIPYILYVNSFYNSIYDETYIPTILITEEILKMFMEQTPSLKRLDFCSKNEFSCDEIYNGFERIPSFILNLPGAKDCLKNLSELKCSTDVNLNSDFLCKLSSICHNIQLLEIHLCYYTQNDGLEDLILSQNNLKSLSFIKHYRNHNYNYDDNDKQWSKIVSSLKPHSSTITNLLFEYRNADFKELQHITFPHLQILTLVNCPVEVNMLINFLENNGKSLKELYVNECNNSLNLTIAEFCPNLKSLYTKFPKNGTEILEAIFKNCQQLDSIETICDDSYIGGKIILEIVVKYSPKNFRELKLLILRSHEKLSSEDLQLFFTGWEARIPQNPISLIISYDNSFEIDINIDEIITKYKKIIKKFKIKKKFFLIYSF